MSENVCFAMHGGLISKNDDDFPCAPTNGTNPNVACCLKGSYCMSNSICYNPKATSGQRYYSADCTDSTMQDPACGTRCGGHDYSIISYISSPNGRWACCEGSNGTIDCDNPSDDQFPGPAPSQLSTIAYISSDGTASYMATPTATGNSNAAATTTPSSSSSSSSSPGIGAGAAAGIGVGVGAGVIIIAAAVAFLYFRNRKPSHTKLQESGGADSPQPGWYLGQQQQALAAGQQPTVYELDQAHPQPKELDSRQHPRPA